ncbi:MAG: hypothetical protein AAGC82_03935 [Pseudomonadota bacterium]
MAVDFALFLSPEGIGLAHRQHEGHWALIGETGLDVSDLGRRLAHLRDLGEARGGTDFPTLLILPDDQILYAELAIEEELGGDLSTAVGRALDGLTPYALGELAFDYRHLGVGRAQVAAVAQETLTEAMDFARAAGFNGVGFAATPPESSFPGVPVFELSAGVGSANLPGIGIPFGPDTHGGEVGETMPPEPAGQVFVTEAAPPAPQEERPAPEPVAEEPVPAAPALSSEMVAEAPPELEHEPEHEPEHGPEHGPEHEPEPEPNAELDAEPSLQPEQEPEPQAETDTEPQPEIATEPEPELDTEPEPQPEVEPDAARDQAAEPEAAPEPDPVAEADPAPAPEGEPVEAAQSAAAPETTPDVGPGPDDDPTPSAPLRTPGIEAADHEAPAFAVDPPAPRFSTHRRLNTSPEAVARIVKKRPSRIELGPVDAAADAVEDAPEIASQTNAPEPAPPPEPDIAGAVSETDTAREPADDTAPPRPVDALQPDAPVAAKTKPPGAKKRQAKTPALFAGDGRQVDAALNMPADPEPLSRVDRPLSEGVQAAANDDVPVGLPPGLVNRLRLRRANARGGAAEAAATEVQDHALHDAATVAFRAPEPTLAAAPVVGQRLSIDDPLMSAGLLARRNEPSTRPSLRTALILTVVLVLILALVAVWSALFLPDSRVAQLLGRVAPDVSAAAPAEPADTVSASPGITAPEQVEIAGSPQATAETDGMSGIDALASVEPPALQTPDTEAALDPAPEPQSPARPITPQPVETPRVPPPTPEMVAQEYEAYGIWQLAPEPPAEPAREFVIPEANGDIELAALQPVTGAHDAVALFAPTQPIRPRPDRAPAGFGATLTTGGLVAPVAEGVRTPEGAFVVLGQPRIGAVQRPGPDPEPEAEAQQPVAQTAAGGLTDAILAAFPPTPRPSDFAERQERQAFGGLTLEELGTRRPVARPQSLQEAATDAQAADAAVGALASSRIPQIRPDSLAEAVVDALSRGPAAGASTAALTAPPSVTPTPAPAIEQAPAPAVEPDIPSNATVSRTATVENGINLREINLIGVRGTPDNRTALVRLASGRFVSVQVGDRLDGGRVAAIGANSLQYIRNGRNITLDAPSG